MQGVAFQYNHGRSTLMWIAPLTLGETDIMHAAPEPPRFPLQLTGEISGPSPIRICRFSVSAGRQRAPAVGFPARPRRHSTKLFDQIAKLSFRTAQRWVGPVPEVRACSTVILLEQADRLHYE